MKLSCLVIESNEKNYTKINEVLSQHSDYFSSINHCINMSSALSFLSKSKADLILVNIELSDGNGFRFLNSIDDLESKIVFVTPRKSAFVDAIEIAELEYVFLPINERKFSKAIVKVCRKLTEASLRSLTKSKVNKIAIPSLTGLDFVDIHSILRCEADNNYTTLFFKNNSKTVVSRALAQFETELSPHQFLRIHHKHLINLKMVKSYSKGKGGGFVVMENDHVIPVSVRKKQSLISAFI